MLQNIRKASKGWVSWVIVVAISIPFALWGIERFNTSGATGDDTLATIGDYELSYYDFYRELNNYNQRLREQYGESFDRIDQEKVRQNVLQYMFGRGVVFADAMVNGMLISDKQIKTYITENELFQADDGRHFDAQKYVDYLAANNITAPVFEDQIRSSELYNQYTQGFWGSNFLTKYELRQIYQLLNHERKIAYAVFPWEQEKDNVEVTSNEVLAKYEENKNRFAVPEKIKIEYVSVSIADLAEKVDYTQQQLQNFYDDKQSDFSTPEEREVRHILFALSDEKLADEVRLKALSGDSFAQLAQEYSIDTLSAEKGGDLGFIGRGIMVEEFENVAFSLQKNAISPLIETQFGYHIIEVTDIKESEVSSLEDVLEKVKQAYQFEKASNQFFEIQEELSNLAFDHSDSLQQIEEKLDLKIQQTDFFSRAVGISSDTITQYDHIREAAFSPQVKNEKINSAVLDIQGQQAVVLRVIDTKASYVRPLDEVKESIQDDLTKMKAADKLTTKISADIALLKSKQLKWKDFIKKYEFSGNSQVTLEWVSINDIDKDTPAEQADIYKTAFETSRLRAKDDNDNTATFINTPTSFNNVAVIYMTNSRDVEVSDEDIAKDSRIWTVMNNFQSANMRNATLEVLQARYPLPKVDVNNIVTN